MHGAWCAAVVCEHHVRHALHQVLSGRLAPPASLLLLFRALCPFAGACSSCSPAPLVCDFDLALRSSSCLRSWSGSGFALSLSLSLSLYLSLYLSLSLSLSLVPAPAPAPARSYSSSFNTSFLHLCSTAPDATSAHDDRQHADDDR
eukprot:3057648-Rhodomonas_salina.1